MTTTDKAGYDVLGSGCGRPAVTGSAPPLHDRYAACQPGDPVRPDPEVRKDGKCACGCGQPLARSQGVRRYAGPHIDTDPFATSRCCRKWHGTIGEETDWQKRHRDKGYRPPNKGQKKWGSRMIIGTSGSRPL